MLSFGALSHAHACLCVVVLTCACCLYVCAVSFVFMFAFGSFFYHRKPDEQTQLSVAGISGWKGCPSVPHHTKGTAGNLAALGAEAEDQPCTQYAPVAASPTGHNRS